MKNLIVLSCLILSACAHNNLKFIDHGKFDQQVQTDDTKNKTEIKDIQEVSELKLSDNDTEDGSRIATENVSVSIDEKFDKISEFQDEYIKNNSEAKEIVAFTKKISKKASKNDEGKYDNGSLFLILALVMALLCILFLFKTINYEVNSSSSDGCLTSILGFAFFAILSAIFGIMAIVFFFIGLVVILTLAVSKSSNKQ